MALSRVKEIIDRQTIMEITAKTIVVLPIESGTSRSGNAWQKQNFIVETTGQYPKKICFHLFGDKVNECPAVGEEVKVSFDIESREYNGRWYTQLNAWKIEKMIAAQPQQSPTLQAQPTPPPTPAQDDGLPF